MFDFDAGKLLIVGVIALIFIPPKDLPRVLRQVGQFVGKMRRMSADFRGQFMDAMREADMADIRKEANALVDAARVDVGFESMHDLDRQMVAKRPAERMSDADFLDKADPVTIAHPAATAASVGSPDLPESEASAHEPKADAPHAKPPADVQPDAPAAAAPHSV